MGFLSSLLGAVAEAALEGVCDSINKKQADEQTISLRNNFFFKLMNDVKRKQNDPKTDQNIIVLLKFLELFLWSGISLGEKQPDPKSVEESFVPIFKSTIFTSRIIIFMNSLLVIFSKSDEFSDERKDTLENVIIPFIVDMVFDTYINNVSSQYKEHVKYEIEKYSNICIQNLKPYLYEGTISQEDTKNIGIELFHDLNLYDYFQQYNGSILNSVMGDTLYNVYDNLFLLTNSFFEAIDM